MSAAKDRGTVTIYDLKNKGKEMKCFAIDAKAFLDHESGRWSKDPAPQKVAKKEDSKKEESKGK